MTSYRPPGAQAPARKVGYLVAVVVNVVLLIVLDVRPGWHELAFLTGRFTDVSRLVNVSLVVSAAVNAVYLWFDPAWFKSLAQVGVSVIGLVVALRTLQVFPFDFTAYAFNWAVLVRVLLVVGVVGSVIGIVVELTRLVGRGVHAVGAGPAGPRGA